MLDHFPMWGLFIITIVIVLLSIECGYRLGRRKRRSSEYEKDVMSGTITTVSLSLLAFMLAFTFGLAASRFQERRISVLDDANAIGTTYLRADYLNEPYREEIRALLRKYVAIRSVIVPETLKQRLEETDRLQDELWAKAVMVAQEDSHSVMGGLFIQSLNAVIDIHEKRVMAGLFSRIPELIWVVLYFLAILSMVILGYNSGLMGSRSFLSIILLTFSFAAVLLLIIDIDRPTEGLIKTSQQPMLDLQNKIGAI